MDPLIISVKRTGPYRIAVEDVDRVRIVDADGNVLIPEPGKAIVLCRCGGSSTKPFCDGTHKTNGFGNIQGPRACPASSAGADARRQNEDSQPKVL